MLRKPTSELENVSLVKVLFVAEHRMKESVDQIMLLSHQPIISGNHHVLKFIIIFLGIV